MCPYPAFVLITFEIISLFCSFKSVLILIIPNSMHCLVCFLLLPLLPLYSITIYFLCFMYPFPSYKPHHMPSKTHPCNIPNNSKTPMLTNSLTFFKIVFRFSHFSANSAFFLQYVSSFDTFFNFFNLHLPPLV